MKLTKRTIDAAKYEGIKREEWDVRWDDQFPGFGLRIYPSGRKAFLIIYRAKGRRRLLTIGDYGVLTVEQARNEAKKRLADVLRGEDPLDARQKVYRGPTVKDLCDDYMERHAKPQKKTWKGDQRFINRYILPAWQGLKVAQIRKADVAALHHKIGKTSHFEANHTLSLLSKMFELARQWGFLEEGAANPARGIQRFPERPRERYLAEAEVVRLFRAIEIEPNTYIREALKLFLLTGLRRFELLHAKWEDLDLERRILRVPNNKSGRPFDLPLSQHALAIFRKIPSLRADGNSYIFPGHVKGRPLASVQKNWERIRTEAGLDDLRLHDLRRTVGSWLVQREKNLQLVRKALNHSDISITAKVYAHLPEDDVRSAFERYGRAVMDLAPGAKAKVVKLTNRRAN